MQETKAARWPPSLRWSAVVGGVTLAWILASPAARSLEWQATIAPVWWQYEERVDRVIPGVAPLRSSASGWGALAGAGVGDGDAWLRRVKVDAMLPVTRADERWAGPALAQSNRLSILQWQAEGSLSRRLPYADIGVYAGFRWHRQHRSGFVVNGLPVSAGHEPVRELVQSLWVGLRAEKRFDVVGRPLVLRLAAGLPLAARASNDYYGTFDTGGGFRLDAGVEAARVRVGRAALGLALIYHFSRLNGDTRSDGVIWPQNTLQLVSLGVTGSW